jgi:hypothetical protein
LVGACTARADASWLDNLLELGEPAPVKEGNLLGRYLGDDRLRALAIGEGATPIKFVANTFWDSQTLTNCQPQPVEGVLRCVGDTGYWLNLGGQYADADCTEFLPYCNTGFCQDTLFFEWDDTARCNGSQGLGMLRRLLSEVTDPVYERDEGTGECTGPVEPFFAWTWEVVDPSEVPAVERQITP